MKDLISVIIPVYNTEEYVTKCLDSVVQQTYENLEIIVIDDGSTDNSFEICKKYAEMDERIILIKQDNQGLSATRNRGIELASGKYIGFVDSDDMIGIHMYEFLYRAIVEQQSEIAIGDYLVFDGGIPFFEMDYSSQKLAILEVLKELMIDKKITSHAVDKLYLKSLFDDIKFPVGKKYEDIATVYKLFLKCSSIAYVDRNLYGYYQRSGSITSQYKKTTTENFIEAINNRYKELVNYDQELSCYVKMNRVNSVLRYFLDIVRFRQIKVLADQEFKGLLDKEIEMAKELFTEEVELLNTKRKNMLIKLLFVNPYLFYYAMVVYSWFAGQV